MIDDLTLYKSIYMLVNTRYSKIITFLYYFQQLDSIVSSEVEHLSLISSHTKRNMYTFQFPLFHLLVTKINVLSKFVNLT